MNFVENGLKRLLEQQQKYNSVDAVYRSGDKTAQVRAVCAGTGSGSNKAGEVELAAGERSFVISREDWPDDPQAGDSITTDGKVYEVSHTAAGVAFYWTNGYHLARRIYTKYLGIETEINDAD